MKARTAAKIVVERMKEFREAGYNDAKNQVYFPEHYAKGWARDAYRQGCSDWEIARGQV